MTRDTSIDAYNHIKHSGVLGKRQSEVYFVLYEHGPMTANEVFKEIALQMHKKAGSLLSVSNSRMSELCRRGVIKELQKRKCSVSGRSVYTYDVTSKLPLKLERRSRIKCPHCKGKGYTEETQTRLF